MVFLGSRMDDGVKKKTSDFLWRSSTLTHGESGCMFNVFWWWCCTEVKLLSQVGGVAVDWIGFLRCFDMLGGGGNDEMQLA